MAQLLLDLVGMEKAVGHPLTPKQTREAAEIAIAQEPVTLKAMGEWLEHKMEERSETAYGRWDIIIELPGIISSLKRGVWPQA